MASHQPTWRRPIADVFRRTANRAVDWCVRRGIHPNWVSYSSIVAAAGAGVCFWQSGAVPALLIPAAGLCYLRLWFNMLDGMVALASGKASRTGEIANELPDRVSDVAIFVGVAHSGLRRGDDQSRASLRLLETARRPRIEHSGATMFRSASTGALWAILGAFPVAALVAGVYRFPVPFTGYLSGPEAMLPAAVAVLAYGVIGGFVVLAVLGAIAGAVAHAVATRSHKAVGPLLIGAVIAIDVAAVMLMATLDKFIGPWCWMRGTMIPRATWTNRCSNGCGSFRASRTCWCTACGWARRRRFAAGCGFITSCRSSAARICRAPGRL